MKFVTLIIIMFIVFILNAIFYRKGLNRGMEYSIDKTMELFAKALALKFDKENKPEDEQIKFIKDLESIMNKIANYD